MLQIWVSDILPLAKIDKEFSFLVSILDNWQFSRDFASFDSFDDDAETGSFIDVIDFAEILDQNLGFLHFAEEKAGIVPFEDNLIALQNPHQFLFLHDQMNFLNFQNGISTYIGEWLNYYLAHNLLPIIFIQYNRYFADHFSLVSFSLLIEVELHFVAATS